MPPVRSAALPFERQSSDATSDAARRARMPAWLASVVLHAILFVCAGLAWKATPHGVPGGEGERIAGIALADLTSGRPEYFYSTNTSDASAGETGASFAAASALPTRIEPSSSQLPGLPTQAESNSSGTSGIGLPAAGEMTGTGRPSRGTGGQTSTGVFGAVGTGSKFIYVFDRSASMADLGGRPLSAAKSQLIRSLENLSDIHQFQIVFYNEEPHIFNPYAPSAPRLIYGDAQSKRSAIKFIDAVTASGGTRHWEALKLALNMRPDVVFFLTDGTAEPLSPSQAAQIERSTERFGTSINVIEFGNGISSGSKFLKRLAQQNHGSYVYVDVTTLSPASNSIQ